jgi:hypothetical protein
MLHGNRFRKGETVQYLELSYLTGTQVSAVSGSLGAAIIPFRETRRRRPLVVKALAVMTLGILIPSYGQETSIFNFHSGFTTSEMYGTSGSGGKFRLIGVSEIKM